VTETPASAASDPEPDAPSGHDVVVIGAGPAGLTAAYMLTKRGVASTILESDDVVGGISRTAVRDGWRFDIGGHRFFTKVKPVHDLWFEILGPDEFLRRPRMSHIHYRGKLYDYPIKPLNALKNLGPVEAVLCGFSYLWAKVRPPKNQDTLEGYVVANYGWRLYNHFFKTYNEKVWGVSASEIAADWGAQRIKGMSLFAAVWEPVRAKLFGNRDGSKQVTSLIEEFNYPKYGPGQMWEKCTELVTAKGTEVVFGANVVKIEHADGAAVAVVSETDGATNRHPCTDVISSMPISALLEAMDPPPPSEVLKAAASLRYRDFMTVALVVPEEYGFADTWIYIHDPDVEVGRIQNFASWSPYLVKDGRTCLGLEFFVQEGDEMWTKSDADLVEQGKRELEHLKLVDA
jgi:protoporphyrinogen oxidase